MPGFLKAYADPTIAGEALRRSRALIGQGIATPVARPGPSPSRLRFDRIDGSTGPALIGRNLESLLAVVADLHRTEVSGLPTHDPLLRIRPRLALTGNARLRALAEGTVPAGRAVLHGDLHVGQFVVTPSGKVWLVDLDDLAIGPPEADLANFTAHLATTEPRRGIASWAGQVRRAWLSLGRGLEPDIFDRCLELALLRRHLKLRAAGRPDFEAEILAYLRESASFSIR